MQLIRAPNSRRVWVVLTLSVTLIVVMAWFLMQRLATLNNGAAWVAHSERVRYQLARTLQTLTDLGNGVTGYQLTHDARLFEPAEAAARELDAQLRELSDLTATDGVQRPLLAKLSGLAAERARETGEQRDRALRGDIAAVQATIASGSARRMLEEVRGVIAQMQTEEQRVLDSHAAAARLAHSELVAGIWGAAAIAIALLFALRQVMVRDAERLRRVQEELATTLRSVGDAVIATDEQGAVRFMNAVAEQLTGWNDTEARGQPLDAVFKIYNEQSHAEVESPVARVLRENAIVGLANHTILRARDGTERPIEDSGAPIRGADGAISGVVMVFRDASEERAARRALVDSRDALREADRRKDVFLATLSHELRNPLAPIRTATRILELPHVSSEDLERSRSIIARQVRHMSSLLDDLLEISRITRGALTLRKEPSSLRGLVAVALETAQPLILAKAHTLKVTEPAIDVRVTVDPVRLTQVIANLLTNAAKYTRPNGQIHLAVVAEGGELEIRVRDNGVGIDPEMLPKVFDMFAQIDSSHEHAEGGIGIGLALVKGFIELHGGTVQASSEGLMRGSEFVVRLPTSIEVPAPAEPSPATGAPAVASRIRVLVADDNRDGADIMGMLLEEFGYEVTLAYDGTEALARATELKPEIAILDIGMPGLSGYQVAERIRAHPWGAQMTLVALTGWGQDDDRRRALEAGFDLHLIKPVDPEALESALRLRTVS